MNSNTIRPSRRRFLAASAAAAGIAAAGRLAMPNIARAQQAGPITVAPLPYPDTGLAPVISAQTIGFHYGKHHMGYADAANRTLEKDDLRDKPMLDIIRSTAANPTKAGLFNAVAQVWNHTFY